MQTLVLLHGAPGSGDLWKPVAEAVGDDIHLVTPTLRWFGSEPWRGDGSDFGTEAHTEQLIGLLENLDGESQIGVAAWSYSTHVLLNALLLRPGLVSKAFLYEPGLSTYLAGEGDLKAFNADAMAAFGPVVAALQTGGAEAAMAALFDSTGGEGCYAALPDARRSAYLASARVLPLLMGGGRPPANITAGDLARIRTPTTVAYGRNSRPLFTIASRGVARAVPGAQLVEVDDADHMLPEKDARRFASMLRDWMEQ